MEQITLAAPALADPGVTTLRVVAIAFDWQRSEIHIILREWDGVLLTGRSLTAEYSGPVALTLMTGLNTANLSIKSLQRRVIERLQADGKLGAGTINGVADV